MSARDRKDARRVVEGFKFQSQDARGSPGRPNRPTEAGPSQSSRREGFGASLSSQASFPNLTGLQQPHGTNVQPSRVTILFDVPDDNPAMIE